MEAVKVCGRDYYKLCRNVLLTDHGRKQLRERFGHDVEKFQERVCNKLETLYKLTPCNKQICLTVAGYKLILEKMSRKGVRCPEEDREDHYLVIVSVLKPSMNWRGDRSKRVRRERRRRESVSRTFNV